MGFSDGGGAGGGGEHPKREILLVVECKIVPFSLHFCFKNPFLEAN